MKKSINGFIIVEGAGDKAFLSSFLDCEIIVLEGFSIPHRTIEYIKALSKFTTPLLLTDPDEAGETIRKRVSERVEGIVNLKIDFVNRKKYKKHGVAETNKESVLKLLEPYYGVYNCFSDIKLIELINIENDYHINIIDFVNSTFKTSASNKKGLLHQLKQLNINLEDIIRRIDNGN